MAGVVEGFRWALLGSATAPGPILAVSALAAVLLLFSGRSISAGWRQPLRMWFDIRGKDAVAVPFAPFSWFLEILAGLS